MNKLTYYRYRLGVWLHQWYARLNPFYTHSLNVFYSTEHDTLFAFDDAIDNLVGLDCVASGCGCGNRDREYHGNRFQVLHARKLIDNLAAKMPKYEMYALDTVTDADYLGVGY